MTPRRGIVSRVGGAEVADAFGDLRPLAREIRADDLPLLRRRVVVFQSTLVAKSSVFGSAGWNSSGIVRRMRYLPERSASGATFCDCPVFLLKRTTRPP